MVKRRAATFILSDSIGHASSKMFIDSPINLLVSANPICHERLLTAQHCCWLKTLIDHRISQMLPKTVKYMEMRDKKEPWYMDDTTLDFKKAFDLVIIANSGFQNKRAEHLVTYHSGPAKTWIDYLLHKKCDQGLRQDRKVMPIKNLTTQYKLMDLEIKRKKMINP
ncbi:hypothetical protein H5410_025767 [Solanum commersonii]|uniref:Uncharacterized protein n=1 Tax=Solanum commersonii TaxID=4109 RepID=A0A9J5YU30_SOLCO|nr:hypothetical protein H5410_025767 [Solanum commersonii]